MFVYTRFRENGDLLPWRGSAAKKKPPFFNARALMTREIMRSIRALIECVRCHAIKNKIKNYATD